MRITYKFKDGTAYNMPIDQDSPGWENEPFVGEIIKGKKGHSEISWNDETGKEYKRNFDNLHSVEIILE